MRIDGCDDIARDENADVVVGDDEIVEDGEW
jgi:hypothetical protein